MSIKLCVDPSRAFKGTVQIHVAVKVNDFALKAKAEAFFFFLNS